MPLDHDEELSLLPGKLNFEIGLAGKKHLSMQNDSVLRETSAHGVDGLTVLEVSVLYI